MRHTDQNRNAPRARLSLTALGLLAAASCASGKGYEPAPSASARGGGQAAGVDPSRLRSQGYEAPDLDSADTPAPYRSVAYTDLPPPDQRAAPAPARAPSPYFTEAAAPSAVTAPSAPTAPTAPTAPSVVPPAPPAAYGEPRRDALPDLDRIVVTDDRTPAAPTRYASAEAAQRFEGETRSVMDDVRRPDPTPMTDPAPMPEPAPLPSYEPVAVSPAPAQAGGYALHLASYRVADQALAGWDVLTRDYPALGQLTPRRTRIDVPGQGAFVRLIAGPFGSDAAAAKACAGLEAAGGYCAVVPFGGSPL